MFNILDTIIDYINFININYLNKTNIFTSLYDNKLKIYKTINQFIEWEPTDDNNFPTIITHSSFQNKNWIPLKYGDNIFVRIADGEIIKYQSDKENILPIFINEAGYYYASSCPGIPLAIIEYINLPQIKFD